MRRFLVATSLAAVLALGAQAIVPSAPANAAAAVQAAPQVKAGAYRLDKSHAKIVWGVSHFGFSTYYGEFTDFDATLSLDPANVAASKLSVTVAMPSVDTHNDALDTHLKNADFFDVAKHSTATFVSTSVRRTGAATADVTGDFTLRGVTRPLTLKVTLNGAGENMRKVPTVGFSATGTVKRSDYGMTYGLPGLGDDVSLVISGEFNAA